MPRVKNVAAKKLNSNQMEKALATFNDERRVLTYGNENKLNRWMCMLNSGENVNVAFLKILGEIEDNLMNRLDFLQGSLENLINKNDQLYTSDILKELKKVGIKLPIKDLNTFIRFDEELESDSQKRHALKCHMARLIDTEKNITKDIAKIMRKIMTTDVEKYYSGCGRRFKGRQKLNYSETNAYLCMQDVLTDKYKKSANKLKILPSVSRWLSQYRDRLPGAGQRRLKRETKESSESSSESSESSSESTESSSE